jgi:hypothetical protein
MDQAPTAPIDVGRIVAWREERLDSMLESCRETADALHRQLLLRLLPGGVTGGPISNADRQSP